MSVCAGLQQSSVVVHVFTLCIHGSTLFERSVGTVLVG